LDDDDHHDWVPAQGEKDRAMHVYDKMIERGLKPNAV
jgi:hypothetical protein